MNEACEGIRQRFIVNVIIIEGRHMTLKYNNAIVVVRIGKKKKTIHAKTNMTDSPYFNDFCVFHFYLSLNVLLDQILTVKVYQKAIARIRKLVGCFKVDLATVWRQPNHQFYHKWAVLENPKNPLLGVRGFLKCDIGILSKGILIQPFSQKEDDEDLDNNILVPHGAIKDRIRTRIVCSIFRADSFSPYKEILEPKIAKPYIRITYCDNVKKTKVAKSRDLPIWNETVIFNDLFPPLSNNILIEICDRDKPKKISSLANTILDIRTLYEDGRDGFLPTFGPNFVYLYQPLKKPQRYRSICTFHNKFSYFCRLLLAIRTETILVPDEVKKKKKKKKKKPFTSIPPLLESKYFQYNNFIAFAAIFDVLFFESKYTMKNIRIRLTMGPRKGDDEKKKVKKKEVKRKAKAIPPESLEPVKTITLTTKCNTTPPLKSKSAKDYSFIALNGRFPCVCVYGEWPDTIRRMHQANVIKKVVENFTKEVDEIRYELQYDEKRSAKMSNKLKQTLAELSKSCEGLLQEETKTKACKPRETNLYRERKRVNHREIENIIKKAKVASMKNALEPEAELNNLSAYLERLTKFSYDPENSFPDMEIWLLKDTEIIAQCTLKTQDVVFSINENERGIFSGKRQTLIIRGKKDKMKAKIDIFIWFGLAENFAKGLEMLPDGYRKENNLCSNSIGFQVPSEIVYPEAHYFQLRAHIFQAGISYGFDRNGLVDAFVRVIILGQSRRTQVRKKTLIPIWKETLFFPEVIIYGPALFIKNHSITIAVEIFDKDKIGYELIGRSFVAPEVKLKEDPYVPPKFPPKLKWENIISTNRSAGRILMAVELLEIGEDLKNIHFFNDTGPGPFPMPLDIQPNYVKYRLEIVFWGVRKVPRKRKRLRNKVYLTLESSERMIKSPILKNVKHKMNFPFSIMTQDVDLPEEPDQAPPLSVKLYHIGSITRRSKYVANSALPSIRQFYVSLLEEAEKAEEKEVRIEINTEKKEQTAKVTKVKKKKCRKYRLNTALLNEVWENLLFIPPKVWGGVKCKVGRKCAGTAYESKEVKSEEKITWWVRYNATIEGETTEYATIKLYSEELESQPQFENFMDYLYTFEMITGNQKNAKKRAVKARVKAALKLYKIPDSTRAEANKKLLEGGILSKSPTNVPEKVVVRVYVISGKNLSARDMNGKSDPYLSLKIGSHIMSDRKNYIPKQLNPTFGKCFEIKATFPEDYLLRLRVLDYNKTSKDDLIGETIVDLENRYYSKYHASCGIPKLYHMEGYHIWRDSFKPSEILKAICHRAALEPPVVKDDKVTIEGHNFETKSPPGPLKEENQALEVLNRWKEMPLQGFQLVPEHVETRTLYHPKMPGIEQGKLIMWIDIFPADYRFLPPKVDITPRAAEPMELRAIVWNVDNVVLNNTSLIFRENMSDIYVRGWMLSLEEEMQKTDVHFRSLDGEGNFNWRFIFHFNYIPSEKRMVVAKKRDAFDMNPEERKVRCKLEIQIWDNNAIGKDDFLGTLILELCAIPRGAKFPGRCTLKMLTQNAAKINLFKIRKTRGWWPFRRHKESESFGNEFELTGKIDLELEILTEAEAKMFPAGKGREEPNALPPPNRPVTSFNWLLNPGKVFRHIIWRKVKGLLIFLAFLAILVTFFLIFLYSFPNYVVKKILRA